MENVQAVVDREKLREAQRLIGNAFGEDVADALQNSADRYSSWQNAALVAPRQAYEAQGVKLYDVPEGSAVSLVTMKLSAYGACEHHYAPCWFKATMGYVPEKSFIGFSRIVTMWKYFACRYTMDERLCDQFVAEFNQAVAPRGVGIVLRAKHYCVISKGGPEDDFPTVTALSGCLREDPAVRGEFYRHAFGSWSDGA